MTSGNPREVSVGLQPLSGSAHSSTRVGLGRDGQGRAGYEEDHVSSLRSETPPSGESSIKPRHGRDILTAVVLALRKRGYPGPDERLKRIVGGQINALLKGGYNFRLIRHFAIELALSWDNAKGHQRMLGLRQAVLQETAEREYRQHNERKREAADVIPVDPAVAIAMLNSAKRRLRHSGDRAAWTVQCARCSRTALYASTTCAEHTPR